MLGGIRSKEVERQQVLRRRDALVDRAPPGSNGQGGCNGPAPWSLTETIQGTTPHHWEEKNWP